MIKVEDGCIGCPKDIGCIGAACPYQNETHLYCDHCGEEVEKLRDFGDEEWCEKCILDEFPVVHDMT